MNRLHFGLGMFAVVLLSLGSYGCSSSQSPDASGSPSASADDHGDHDHDGQSNGTADDQGKIDQHLATLSEADRMSVKEQHDCPVSGETLGSMGTPIKVHVNNQDVWICCPACKDKLLANPDEYLATMKP